MNEAAEIACAVCACSVRREIDMMLLEGWNEAQIIETLPDAPRDPLAIAAHWRAGHADFDKAALTVVVISTMRDSRFFRTKALEEIKDGHWRFGGLATKCIEQSIKAVELMARLNGHMNGQSDAPPVITKNTFNIALAADPEVTYRIAKAMVDKAEQVKVEVRKKKALPAPVEANGSARET
jgi:hypothetical protein